MNAPARVDALLRSPPFPPARRPHEVKSGLMPMQPSDWAELKREAESEAEWRTYCATVPEAESDHPAVVVERRTEPVPICCNPCRCATWPPVCLLTEPRRSPAERGHWRRA